MKEDTAYISPLYKKLLCNPVNRNEISFIIIYVGKYLETKNFILKVLKLSIFKGSYIVKFNKHCVNINANNDEIDNTDNIIITIIIITPKST